MALEMTRIRQLFDSTCLEDIEGAIKAEMERFRPHVKPDSRIAVTAGSRGIDRIDRLIRTAVEILKGWNARPVLIPAMGSHGGATAAGQLEILEGLGITEETAGAPILSSMEVVETGYIENNGVSLPVVVDKNAWECDGILVMNRVKPHTSFHGETESGIVKMIAIGLGKKVQATNIHRYGTRGLKELLVPAARKVIDTGRIIGGIGIVENAYDRIYKIKGFLPDEITDGDRQLLRKARERMPCLPAEQLDILIVDEMGKDISGTGMDTNIIGRLMINGEPEPESPSIRRIVVLGLTPGTRGNAYGMGLADFVTASLAEKIDYRATYMNALSSTFTGRARLPVVAADEREATDMALRSCGIDNPGKARVIRIKNTLSLGEMMVSKTVLQEIGDKKNIVVCNKQGHDV